MQSSAPTDVPTTDLANHLSACVPAWLTATECFACFRVCIKWPPAANALFARKTLAVCLCALLLMSVRVAMQCNFICNNHWKAPQMRSKYFCKIWKSCRTLSVCPEWCAYETTPSIRGQALQICGHLKIYFTYMYMYLQRVKAGGNLGGPSIILQLAQINKYFNKELTRWLN